MSEISDFIRKSFKEGDDKRDAGLTTPENIIRYDDLLYGEDPRWQVLDVYRPRDREGEKLPVIVSVHGGGWVYGDKERYQYYCMDLAQRGFAVVNFTYRLAPEYQFPAPLEDTNSVFAWVLAHSEEYGLDKEKVFALGDSAGGNILGLYCALCTNKEYAGQFSFHVPDGFVPAAVALNCGDYVVDAGRDQPGNMTMELMKDYLPEKGTEKELALLNVTKHITEDYPPVFLMTASGDALKEQGLFMAAKLTEKNVPFLYRMYGDKTNLLPHVFHCNIRSEAAKSCNDDQCSFFKGFCS